MEENVFDSYEDIDAALDKEYAGVDDVTPETEPNEEPAQEPEVEEPTVEEPVEEQIEEEEVPQNTNEGKNELKKDYAFSNLRKERDSYKADSDYLKELANSYGYEDISKFKEAINNSRYQREAQEKGYDLELYKKSMEQERRIAQLEAEREQELKERKLDRVQFALEEATKEYGVDAQTIFARLEEYGISADSILNIETPKILIDGVMKEEIRNSGKQTQIKDLQNFNGLVEDKNEQTGSAPKVTIESLLKDDLANYKKENFYD